MLKGKHAQNARLFRLVQEREARLASPDAAIACGGADADAGRVTDAASAFGKLAARYQPTSRAPVKRTARKRR
jgi:predicted transcriptional regulator